MLRSRVFSAVTKSSTSSLCKPALSLFKAPAVSARVPKMATTTRPSSFFSTTVAAGAVPPVAPAAVDKIVSATKANGSRAYDWIDAEAETLIAKVRILSCLRFISSLLVQRNAPLHVLSFLVRTRLPITYCPNHSLLYLLFVQSLSTHFFPTALLGSSPLPSPLSSSHPDLRPPQPRERSPLPSPPRDQRGARGRRRARPLPPQVPSRLPRLRHHALPPHLHCTLLAPFISLAH